MKHFIIKTGIFFVLIVLTVCFLSSKRSSPHVSKYKNITTKLDVINLGTSHGNGIVYNDFINGKGFQRPGNTLYYDLQNYRYLQKYLNQNAVVIIPVSYFSFGLDENRTDYSDSKAFVNDFYFYLPAKSIYNYDRRKEVSVYLNKAKSNFNSVLNERFFRSKKIDTSEELTKEQKLINHAKQRAQSHKKLGMYSSPGKNIDYLITLIREVKENGHEPVLLTVPYYEAYNNEMGEDWIQNNYYKYMYQIFEEFDVQYLNYSEDSRFVSIPSFYSNSDHLNLKGAKYFSDILFNDLRELKVLN